MCGSAVEDSAVHGGFWVTPHAERDRAQFNSVVLVPHGEVRSRSAAGPIVRLFFPPRAGPLAKCSKCGMPTQPHPARTQAVLRVAPTAPGVLQDPQLRPRRSEKSARVVRLFRCSPIHGNCAPTVPSATPRDRRSCRPSPNTSRQIALSVGAYNPYRRWGAWSRQVGLASDAA